MLSLELWHFWAVVCLLAKNRALTLCVYFLLSWLIYMLLPSPTHPPQILLQPFTYIQQIPGKQFRSELALAFNHWLLIPAEKLTQIGEVVQMLHNSSLLWVETIYKHNNNNIRIKKLKCIYIYYSILHFASLFDLCLVAIFSFFSFAFSHFGFCLFLFIFSYTPSTFALLPICTLSPSSSV